MPRRRRRRLLDAHKAAIASAPSSSPSPCRGKSSSESGADAQPRRCAFKGGNAVVAASNGFASSVRVGPHSKGESARRDRLRSES